MTPVSEIQREITLTQEDLKNKTTMNFSSSRITIIQKQQKYLGLKDGDNLVVIPIKEKKGIFIKVLDNQEIDKLI